MVCANLISRGIDGGTADKNSPKREPDMIRPKLITVAMLAIVAGTLLLTPKAAVAQAPPRLGSSPGYYGNYYPGSYYSNYYPGSYYTNYYPGPYGGNYRYYGYDTGYYRGSGYGFSSLNVPPGEERVRGAANLPGTTTSPYGSVPRASATIDRTAALADVWLPSADAELWVEGQKTKRTGTYRQFVSPPLAPGKKYAYDFRARWLEGGREVTQTRTVYFRAGDQITVDFTAPPPKESDASPKDEKR
jgi:uncharacterized protein (TIGR03000 family)